MLHGPDGWRVARLVLDQWSVALFSSRGPAFAAVEQLKAEGLTTAQAIDRIAGGTGAVSGTGRRKGGEDKSHTAGPDAPGPEEAREDQTSFF